MFQPPPDDNRDQISEQPMPALPPIDSPALAEDPQQLAHDAPPGDALFEYVVVCLDKGSSQAEVRKQLIAFGYSTAEAEETVKAVANWRHNYPAHSIADPHGTAGGGNASMWIGGIICLVGLVVTIGSCLAAGEGGGRYYVAWGAIVFGGIQFFRGLSQRSH